MSIFINRNLIPDNADLFKVDSRGNLEAMDDQTVIDKMDDESDESDVKVRDDQPSDCLFLLVCKFLATFLVENKEFD